MNNEKINNIISLKDKQNMIAMIAVSPFNGYFTTKNIENLIFWGKKNFKDIFVFTMDESSKYNLMALGYDEDNAIKKTKKQDKGLYNKIFNGFEKAGFLKEEISKKIIKMSDTFCRANYIDIYKKCLYLYKNNPDFQNDCLETTKDFLMGKNNFSQEDANLAVQYLLDELPTWFQSGYIFNISSLVLVYKDLPSPLQRILYNYGVTDIVQDIVIKNIENDYECFYPLRRCNSLK